MILGDIWSGSEAGVIKIWPWETVGKALSLTSEERHMAALLVERSFIDPRGQVAANGLSNVLTSDLKFLLSDKIRAKVWSASYLSFALWYMFRTLLHFLFCFCVFLVKELLTLHW